MTTFTQFIFKAALAISCLLCLMPHAWAQCPTGTTITLATQADVDAFPSNCTYLNSNFRIGQCQGTPSDITDLSNLSNLTGCSGQFFICNNPLLTNLNGLGAFEDATDVFISFNSALADISGLSQLNGVGGLELRINQNPLLENVNGLSSITNLTRLELFNNDLLSDLSGLSNLQTIHFNLGLEGNPVLETLEDLTGLVSIGSVNIDDNVLLDVCAIPAVCASTLTFINGNLAGGGCENIPTIQAACATLCPTGTTHEWTGCNSSDWDDPQNWLAGTVPTASDDVLIPDVANDPIINAGVNASTNSVTILAGAHLTINNLGSLSANGELLNSNGTVNAIVNFGLIENDGLISVSASQGTGLRNYDEIINSGVINLTFIDGSGLVQENATFTNTSTGIIETNFIGGNSINNVGTFNNAGLITLRNLNATGLSVQGPFTNTGTIEFPIDNGAGGNPLAIFVRLGTIFTNSGCASLVNIAEDGAINTQGTFNNEGVIIENASGNSNITSNTGTVQNLNGGTFNVGSGNAPITSSGDVWTGCVSTDWSDPQNWLDSTVPTVSDNVTIPDVANDPIINSGVSATANSVTILVDAHLTISNMGSLEANGELLNSNGTENAIVNFGLLENNGELSVSSSAGTALRNYDEIINTGLINLESNAGGIAQENSTFTNTSTGIIELNNIQGNSIGNVGTFDNAGLITLKNLNTTGISVQGPFTNTGTIDFPIDNGQGGDPLAIFVRLGTIFTNSGCASLVNIAEDGAINTQGTFNNEGVIIENASGNSNITSNTGIVQNLNGGTFTINNGDAALTSANPTALCQDYQVVLDVNGNASINATDIDAGSTNNIDACDPAVTLIVSQDAFDCDDLGDNMVTLTVTDAEGNIATCMATVNVFGDLDQDGVCDAQDNCLLAQNNVPNLDLNTCECETGYVATFEALFPDGPEVLTACVFTCPTGTTHEWTGCIDSDWYNPQNWLAGTVPTITDAVTIPDEDNDPVIDATGAVAQSVVVEAGAILTITNNGNLNISGATFDGINSNGTVNNAGNINISNTTEDGYQNAGGGVLNNTGNISIWNTGKQGIQSTGNSTITNAGTITINDVMEDGILLAGATITNNGDITISNTGNFGIQSSSGGVLVNNGTVSIDNTQNDGIINSMGDITNVGGINIGILGTIGGNGIQNNNGATFTNEACATINLFDDLANFGTFNNDGLFTISTTETSTVGNFTNDGVIEDIEGTLPTVANNNDVIVRPLEGNDCSTDYFNALTIGGMNSFTPATTWYSDINLAMPIGTYDLVSNTFSPNNPISTTQTVFFEITDNDNNCTRLVWVRLLPNETGDTEPPTVTCPAPVSTTAVLGSCSAFFDVQALFTDLQDNCPGIVQTDYVNDEGDLLWSLGLNEIEMVIFDAAGNQTFCTVELTVFGTDLVDITCPANITVSNDAGTCGAIVDYIEPIGTGNCTFATSVSTSQTAGLGSGATFPVGETTETYTVTNTLGNTVSCSFTVTVEDTEAPIAICQDFETFLDNTSGDGLIYDFEVDAGSTDNCSGELNISLSQYSFNCDNLGENTVTLTVQDVAGNTATCDATVTVLGDTDQDGICDAEDDCPFAQNDVPNLDLNTCDCESGYEAVFGPLVIDGPDVLTACEALYCESYGQSTEYEWIESIALNGTENVSGNDGGYGDYTDVVLPLATGTNTLHLTPGFSAGNFWEFWSIFIDYNQDGDFDDPGELAYYQASTNTINTNFHVPTSAMTGQTRMRISMRYNQWSDQCDVFGYGEVEDYTVDISFCDNVVDGGQIGDDEILCDGADDPAEMVSLVDANGGSGTIEYLWLMNTITSTPPGTSMNGWVEIPNSDAPTYDPGPITQTTWYIRCARRSGCTQYLGESNVIEKKVQAVCTPDYCDSEGENTQYEWIKKVRIQYGFNNVSGDDGGYGDYTHLSVDLYPGEWPWLQLKPGFSGYSYAEYWRVWVDWNQDGDFEDAGELETQGASSGTIWTNISVPHNIATGSYRMRVSMKFDEYPTSCEVFSEGEVEDYTINIIGSQAAVVATNDELQLEAALEFGKVNLVWVNNTGYKNDHFEIEKSIDGRDFETMKEKANEDDTEMVQAYTDSDESPYEGLNYYRIKLVLQDGSAIYSNVKEITLPQTADEVVLYPNPAEDQVFLNLESYAGYRAVVKITNNLGQVLQSEIIDALPETDISLSVTELKEGQYWMMIQVDGFRMITKRFVVMKSGR